MTTLDELCRRAARLVGQSAERTVYGLRIRRVETPGMSMPFIADAAFGLVLQGRKRTTVAGNVFDYGPGDCLVLSVSMPVTGQVTVASHDQPYLALACGLEPAEISELLLETGQDDAIDAMQSTTIHAAEPELLDALMRLLALADRPGDALVMQPLLRKEIMWRLLDSPHGAMLRQLGLRDGRLARVSRTIHWLRQHYGEPMRIDTLEQVSGMSAASLFRHFKAVTFMSPLQYQKQIRLHEARVRLVAGARDVAQVAYEVGYESPSQFTREYGRLFGHPPREDLRRPPAHASANRCMAASRHPTP